MDAINGSRPAYLMIAWCTAVGLTGILKADGSVGECALNALNETFKSPVGVLDNMREGLACVLETVFTSTGLFKHLDSFKNEADPAGPGLLKRTADGLRCGMWCGAAAFQAYVRILLFAIHIFALACSACLRFIIFSYFGHGAASLGPAV